VSLAIVATFAIASALAGAAGVLLAWNFTALSPFFGVKVGLKGLAIMLLGGLGNVTGAMVGGLLIGVVEVLSVAYLASSYRVTFGFGEMVRVLFLNAPAFGGPAGFAGIPAATTFWHVLGLLVVLVYFFARVSGSRMGRAFAALRDDEAAAEAMGVNSTYVKLAAFAAGGVIAGLGGGLYAHYTPYIDPDAFGVSRSLFVMLYAG